jgi:CII-binding regulator of phage lambda lysogenization HflD
MRIYLKNLNYFIRALKKSITSFLSNISNRYLIIKLIKTGEIIEQIFNRLEQMYEKMNNVAKDYKTLLESLISIFKDLEEVREINYPIF